MADVRITLAGLWIALMLTYLLGAVLRIFAGDFTPGEIDGQPANEAMRLVAAGVMLVPIVMIVLSQTPADPVIRWVGLVASAGLVISFGRPYPGVYDNVLIVVASRSSAWSSATRGRGRRGRGHQPNVGLRTVRPMAAPEGRQPPANRRA